MKQDKVVIYKDEAGEFRWKFVRSNGKTMAVSSEGYKRRTRCSDAAWYVINGWGMEASPLAFGVDE